jgi:hypothetical protein
MMGTLYDALGYSAPVGVFMNPVGYTLGRTWIFGTSGGISEPCWVHSRTHLDILALVGVFMNHVGYTLGRTWIFGTSGGIYEPCWVHSRTHLDIRHQWGYL